jgi:hypothetical protein
MQRDQRGRCPRGNRQNRLPPADRVTIEGLEPELVFKLASSDRATGFIDKTCRQSVLEKEIKVQLSIRHRCFILKDRVSGAGSTSQRILCAKPFWVPESHDFNSLRDKKRVSQ